MRFRILILVLVLLGASCATEVANFSEEAPALSAAEGDVRIVTVLEATAFKPSRGSKMSLKAGSKWKEVGTLPQGVVLRSIGDVLTLHARHIHEAYLIVSGGSLNGLYLPVERRVVSLKGPVPIETDQ